MMIKVCLLRASLLIEEGASKHLILHTFQCFVFRFFLVCFVCKTRIPHVFGWFRTTGITDLDTLPVAFAKVVWCPMLGMGDLADAGAPGFFFR